MGTNFYLETIPPPPCDCCGRPYEVERKHIGKSSAGWVFSLHIIPEEGIDDLPDWERLWTRPGVRIVDEYGEVWSPEDMRKKIAERSSDVRRYPGGLHNFEGSGAGTWDRYTGSFS
jgi:hypothetical protein